MPVDVLEVTKRFMREPVRILVKKEELTLEGIRQFYIQVEKEVRVIIIQGVTNGGACTVPPPGWALCQCRNGDLAVATFHPRGAC